MSLVKRKYSYNGELITLKDRIMKLPGKMPMVFLYFTLWAAYISLIMYGIAPGFYTLSTPPALQKMKEMDNPTGNIYSANYYDFLENRHNAEYK